MPLTNYWSNKKVDHEFRAQANPVPASWWVALLTAASRTGGTLQTAGGVVPVQRTSSLGNCAGTQAAGSTTASSGTSRTTSNNGTVQFAAAASAQISASHVGLFDGDPTASPPGQLCRYYAIKDSGGNDITRTWEIGDPVEIAAGQLQITME
jgi:hypothetical protein